MTGEGDAPGRPMADPETLAIRAGPPRAIRFKRGMIIAIAALGSISLVAVAWTALTPRMFHRVGEEEELSQPNVRPASDALAGAPASYGDVPRLGPPLPGDLGGPLFHAEQQAAAGSSAPVGPLHADPTADAARIERIHRMPPMIG